MVRGERGDGSGNRRLQAKGRARDRSGHTTTRTLETAALSGTLRPFAAKRTFTSAPHTRFGAVDAMITNFHLPRTTLLLLVGAFAGSSLIEQAYREAIASNYRFTATAMRCSCFEECRFRLRLAEHRRKPIYERDRPAPGKSGLLAMKLLITAGNTQTPSTAFAA